MQKKNIEEFITGEKARGDAYLAGRIHTYFSGADSDERKAIAMEMFTEYPFAVLGRFHHWAFGDQLPELDVEAHLERDRAGHKQMQRENLQVFLAPDSEKTDEERGEYFSGIATVFPLMMVANYHRWLAEGLEGAGDFMPTVDKLIPEITKRYQEPIQAAYRAGDEAAKRAAYSRAAEENLYDILRAYYAWLTESWEA